MAQRLIATSRQHVARTITIKRSIGTVFSRSTFGGNGLIGGHLSNKILASFPLHGRRWYTALAERHEEDTEELDQGPAAVDPDQEEVQVRRPSTSLPADVAELAQQYGLPDYLRPYQVEVIHACMSALDRGVDRIGVSSPTGSGKTVMFTNLIPLLRARAQRHPTVTGQKANQVLILVGSIELARQAMSTIRRTFPEYRVELEQGTNKGSGFADVTVATYHSLKGSRLERYDPTRFCAVIVDEAHHAAAPSYLKLLQYFNNAVGDKNTKTKVTSKDDEASRTPTSLVAPADDALRQQATILGFTATFSRHDQLALSLVFDEIVYHQDVWDMLQAGWLAPARFTTVKTDLRLADVAISERTGDFIATKLSDKVNTEETNELVVRSWLDRAADRKSTLVFCVDLAHVEDLTQMFRSRGIDARWVSSKTADRDRKALIESFKAQEFPVLVNCEILTEGTDIPKIDTIVIARPTKSRNLFSQMIGRGLRNSPGKEDCRIIDMVDNTTNVDGLISAPTLFGLDPIDADVEDQTVAQLRIRGEAYQEEKALEAEELAKQEALSGTITYEDDDDPFRFREQSELDKTKSFKSRYAWVNCGDDKYVVEAMGNGYFSVIKEGGRYLVRFAAQLPKEMREMRKNKSPYGLLQVAGSAIQFRQAMAMADKLVERNVPKTVISQLYRWASWRQKPATAGQKTFLRSMLQGKMPENSQHRFMVKDSSGLDEFDTMKCGRAASMITALKHGAKKRADKQAKQADTAEKKKDRIKQKGAARLAAQTVRIGKL